MKTINNVELMNNRKEEVLDYLKNNFEGSIDNENVLLVSVETPVGGVRISGFVREYELYDNRINVTFDNSTEVHMEYEYMEIEHILGVEDTVCCTYNDIQYHFEFVKNV